MSLSVYFGVVEDREGDPQVLCRYRVRVIGVHSPLLHELPTNDLPWALPIQNNSAAISGIGSSPNGYLQGSTVAVIFADEDLQIPLILGSIAGVASGTGNDFGFISQLEAITPPAAAPANIVKLPSGQTVPLTNASAAIPGITIISPPYIGTLTVNQVNTLKSTIAFSESGTQGYSAINTLGFLGKYQFGVLFLEDMGYIVKGAYNRIRNNLLVISDPLNWTGKDGISSKESFLGSASIQEASMDKMLKRNYTSLARTLSLSNTPPEKIAGLLMTAHLKGAGKTGASGFVIYGNNTTDANGTSCWDYYLKGYKCIIGQNTQELPTLANINSPAIDKNSIAPVISTKALAAATVPGQLPPSSAPSPYSVPANKPEDGSTGIGFVDPEKRFPLTSHSGESDVPRLASGESILYTIVSDKDDDRDLHIPVANSTVNWSQSPIPYNATYPNDRVYQSESGHIIEYDDTPGAERINIHHAAGTFYEVDSEGNLTNKVKGSRTIIVESNDMVYVQGSGHVTIDGDMSVLVRGQSQVEIIGNSNIVVHGDLTQQVYGSSSTHVFGDYNLEVDGNMNTLIKGALNTEVIGALSLGSNSNIGVNAGGMVSLDGSTINWNSGVSSPVSVNTIPSTAPYSPTITMPNPTTKLKSYIVLTEGPDNAAIRQSISSIGPQENNSLMIPVGEVITAVAPTISKIPTDCLFGSLTLDTQLSTNFTLRDLVSGPGMSHGSPFPFNVGQCGLSDQEIVCNLRKLCINILEPIRAAFSTHGFQLNSVFRLFGTFITASGKPSQHNLGQAADISFTSLRAGDYATVQVPAFYEMAKAILALGLPIDQFIFETDPAKGQVWLHVSYNEASTLPRPDGTSLLSYYGKGGNPGGSDYIRGLVLHS